MPAGSSRGRATHAVNARSDASAPSSHLVLVPLPTPLDLSALAAANIDTAQPPAERRQAFCAKLRAARERRGIPLSTIAAATKVSVSHLTALERNDLSRWPAGIYRRAWIRAYADAVGLPVDATLEEFVVVFDPAPPTPQEQTAEPSTETSLRLTLATPRAARWSSLGRLRTHAVEITVAVVLAILVAWFTGSGLWVVAGVLALCAYGPLVAAIKRATKATKI